MDPWSTAIVGAVEKVANAAVHVTAEDAKDQSVTFGSGFALDPYHVITTAQIVGMGDAITIQGAAGRTVKAHCLGVDPLYYVAVCELESRLEVEPTPIVSMDELKAGQMVVAVGNPFGYDQTVSAGVISAINRTVYRPERFPVDGLLIVDAKIHPGNSGGPLIDLDGRWVGMNGLPWVHGLSLVVQAQVAARVANQIIEYGEATHPWLGFSGEPEILDQTWVELLQLPTDRGLIVKHVADEGPGRSAGIEVGDLVIRADGRPITSSGGVRQTLALRRPGDRVTITVVRSGDLVDLTLPVEPMPNLGENQAAEPGW